MHVFTCLLTDPDLDVADAKLADFGLMVLAARQTQMARNELKNAAIPTRPVGALSMLTTSRAEREADQYAAKRAEKEELMDQADPLYVLPLNLAATELHYSLVTLAVVVPPA